MEDIFVKNYTVLNDIQKADILFIKQKAEDLYMLMKAQPSSRRMSIAITELENSIMWAVKAIANPESQ